ncbi:MAG: hypothetical protein HWN66_01700 [Candidatus Helarchaeota archaeon]|nr:hypothetical protein [Candidatus Helarchaeota archaeon]
MIKFYNSNYLKYFKEETEIFQRLIEFLDQQLLVRTNSETILDYLELEYGNYFGSKESQVFGHYFPIKSESFEKLKFPPNAKIVWAKKHGKVTHKDGNYYGIYHDNLVKGFYDTKKNIVTNLIRDPSYYFNICVGVIDYLFSKTLLQKEIFRIHAACVSKDNEGMLICGSKSTGKTTLLMKLLRDGYKFVADDSAFVRFKKNGLICHPFPKTIKLNYEDLEKFPKLYQNLKYSTILTSDGIQKAIIKPEDNHFPIVTHEIPIAQIFVPSITDSQQCNIDEIHPIPSETQYCVVDVLKRNLSFDLLIPSFRGENLLNIDYIENPEITKKQDLLCQQTIQSYKIKFFKIGSNIEDINIKKVLYLSDK